MTQPQLICSHLTKRFGDTVVVNDLSFELQAGECLGVIGPNGAGKTTTFRMCLGLSTADSGSISVFGMSMPEETLGYQIATWAWSVNSIRWTPTSRAAKT